MSKFSAIKKRFQLAITGPCYAAIRENYPALIPKIVVATSVFARMSPEQKATLIEDLQKVEYIVAMCGDGKNLKKN